MILLRRGPQSPELPKFGNLESLPFVVMQLGLGIAPQFTKYVDLSDRAARKPMKDLADTIANLTVEHVLRNPGTDIGFIRRVRDHYDGVLDYVCSVNRYDIYDGCLDTRGLCAAGVLGVQSATRAEDLLLER